jgi:protein gp37
MGMWSPWRGCHRYSEGCEHCYIHKGDAKRGVDTNNIEKTEKFYAPIEKNAKGEYKMKSGQTVYICFSSDFLIDEADPWRDECWDMIKTRNDLFFIFLTKRIERFEQVMPKDWGDGYDNVLIGCTAENQKQADFRLGIFDQLRVKHKNIICQPLLENIELGSHLGGVERVIVGGESDPKARPLNFDWVLDIRATCEKQGTAFEFRQCGTHFIKDGREYRLKTKDLAAQAKKANINFEPEKV